MRPREFIARFAHWPAAADMQPAERAEPETATRDAKSITSQQEIADPDKAILAAQVRVLYVEGQRLILTGIAAGSILVWVLWGHVAPTVLLGWLGAFVIYSLVRMAMTRAYRRQAVGSLDHRAWMTRVQWALAVGGSFWAIACFLFYVPDRIEYQLFLVTMLLGAVVSGLVTLAVYPPAYMVFMTPFVVATIIRYGIENDPLHWGIALAAIAVLFLFTNFARYIRNTFVASLRLRMELAARNRELAERNREVERANLAKSRFLAAASHDLRQPLHALNLFVAQLRDETDDAERGRLVTSIDAAVDGMNELFNALLDISKLDAGVLAPSLSDFPVDHILKRVESTFAGMAREKGLRLRVTSSGARVRSDAILLERVLLNLVSNAVRYTAQGGVVIGCRRRGDVLRIEVWDTGVGIPEDQQRSIFGEFYQVATPGLDRRIGLGLGLAIVERLCHLLGHPVELTSTAGRGSRFTVSVPLTATRQVSAAALVLPEAIADPARDKLVVVIDDETLVLEGMRGLLQSWGCRVIAAESDSAALASLARHNERPDLIISDYRLAGGSTGFDVIERLRSTFHAPIPTFLITGDTTPERMHEARASGFTLLHKPVNPMALRAAVNQLLRRPDAAGGLPAFARSDA